MLPATCQAVELSCVLAVVPILIRTVQITHDNVSGHNSEYVSQAAAQITKQVSSNFRPQMVANSIRTSSEAITYNLDQTSRYSANYTHMTANKIDVIDMACEEYSQEVLGFTDIIASGNFTPEPTTPPQIINNRCGGRKELKLCEAKTIEPSVHEPPEVELKELPPHLEYAFLEGDNKLPVIIAKELDVEEKSALIKVLKVPQASSSLAGKLSDNQGYQPGISVPTRFL
ncbi:hypothetical protein Tco_1354324 [Tanacetum coccineum]